MIGSSAANEHGRDRLGGERSESRFGFDWDAGEGKVAGGRPAGRLRGLEAGTHDDAAQVAGELGRRCVCFIAWTAVVRLDWIRRVGYSNPDQTMIRSYGVVRQIGSLTMPDE